MVLGKLLKAIGAYMRSSHHWLGLQWLGRRLKVVILLAVINRHRVTLLVVSTIFLII